MYPGVWELLSKRTILEKVLQPCIFGSRPIVLSGDLRVSFHLTSLGPGVPLVKVHRGVLGFVFAESPDPAPHANPVTALEQEGRMQ